MNGRTNTLIICGTVIVLAIIGALLYMSSTTTPSLAALGILATICASVLAGTFGLVKVDQLGTRLTAATRTVEQAADTVVEQTNGALTDRIRTEVRAAVVDVLDEHGLLLDGRARGRAGDPPGPGG